MQQRHGEQFGIEHELVARLTKPDGAAEQLRVPRRPDIIEMLEPHFVWHPLAHHPAAGQQHVPSEDELGPGARPPLAGASGAVDEPSDGPFPHDASLRALVHHAAITRRSRAHRRGSRSSAPRTPPRRRRSVRRPTRRAAARWLLPRIPARSRARARLRRRTARDLRDRRTPQRQVPPPRAGHSDRFIFGIFLVPGLLKGVFFQHGLGLI